MRRRTLAHMMSSIVDQLDNMEKNENNAAVPTVSQQRMSSRHPVNVLLRPTQPNSVSILTAA